MYVLRLGNVQGGHAKQLVGSRFQGRRQGSCQQLIWEPGEPEFELWLQSLTSSVDLHALHKLQKRLFIQQNEDDDNSNYHTELFGG